MVLECIAECVTELKQAPRSGLQGWLRVGTTEMTQESSGNPLSSRQHALILAAVQEFVATAEPVGSAQIVARHQLGVRAAMVRNMMAELEDGGYLRQPHTSAGGGPTAKAVRYYG